MNQPRLFVQPLVSFINKAPNHTSHCLRGLLSLLYTHTDIYMQHIHNPGRDRHWLEILHCPLLLISTWQQFWTNTCISSSAQGKKLRLISFLGGKENHNTGRIKTLCGGWQGNICSYSHTFTVMSNREWFARRHSRTLEVTKGSWREIGVLYDTRVEAKSDSQSSTRVRACFVWH